MKNTAIPSALVLALAIVFFGVAAMLPASGRADDKPDKRFTITAAPVYIFATNSDANASAPPPPGTTTAIGYTRDHPVTDTYQLDYGASFAITKPWNVFYSHSNVAYQLGRILTVGPNTSFVSGSIYDYTDTYGTSYAFKNLPSISVSYFSHQRRDVTGLCLNQKVCVNPATGVKFDNPLSINSHGWDFGLAYSFLPNSRVGNLLTATVDFDYYIRPGTAPTGAALGGLPKWVGNTWEIPYSLTLRVPVVPDKSFIPSVTYIALPVLYQDSAVPEDYRGFVYGFTKVIDPYVNLSYMNYVLKTCICVARVPPPDNLRLTWGELKLDFHYSF